MSTSSQTEPESNLNLDFASAEPVTEEKCEPTTKAASRRRWIVVGALVTAVVVIVGVTLAVVLTRPNSTYKCFETNEELQAAVYDYQTSFESSNSKAAKTYGYPIGSWCVDEITDFSRVFQYSTLNEPIDSWNVSQAIRMDSMFRGSSFNQPLASWDVSRVRSMNSMFSGNEVFNQPLPWNVSSLIDASKMFEYATSFNQPSLSSWNVSSLFEASYMFSMALKFNVDLSSWSVGGNSLRSIEGMFSSAISFDQDMCPWADKLSTAVDVSLLFHGSNCPEWGSPEVLNDAWAGPFCHVCE